MNVLPIKGSPARPAGRLQHEASLGTDASAVCAIAIRVVVIAVEKRVELI